MPEHPSTQQLAAFLAADRRSRSEPSRVVRHLLAGCDTCLARLRELDTRGQLPRPLPGSRWSLSRPASEGQFDYSRTLARAERTIDLFFTNGRPVEAPPGILLAELGLPVESAQFAPGGEFQTAIPFLTRWLIEKSHAIRYSNPEEMLHWALMARVAACGCTPDSAGSKAKLSDLRAEAEAQCSNALRVLGRLVEAEDTMKMAWRYLERGTGNPELRAAVFARTASLLTLQRKFQAASELAHEASVYFEDLGMKHRSASAEVTGAIATLYSGDPEQASRLFCRLLPKIPRREDPSLFLAARINLVACYVDLGKLPEARQAYRALPPTNPDSEPLILLRMEWQKGLLLNALQERISASQTLGRVRKAYIERRLAREAIVVTRDLMRTFEHLGEGGKAAILREETASWLQSMKFGAEASRFFQELQQPASG
ncbi:MAG TPA: tetratricopeptide repeat protein [Thermoanaerobaculia bacterium]